MHSILINEFLPNPIGADQGNEWIEIVNTSSEEIDISNWEIQVAGITFKRAFKFPSSSNIKPGEYILICEQNVPSCNYYTTLIAIQNGGKETDGVRLVNEKLEIIDTILYDTTNSNQLKNDFDLVETDENIIDMPPEGCSLSRKNYQDTNFSIKDFFITCTPTPGKENIEIGKIVISEVALDCIEFYSPSPPADLEKWYIKDSKESLKKIYLQNITQNNFFSIDKQVNNNTYLYSPEHILIDSFTTKNISNNYTYCRLQSSIEENFTFCEKTKSEKNEKKVWQYTPISQILQINTETQYINQPCVVYQYKELFIVSDESAAMPVICNGCEKGNCFTAELWFKKTQYSTLEILENSESREINIESMTKDKHTNFLNKIVKIDATFEKSDNLYSYFITDIGILRVEKDAYLTNHEYTLQGILQNEKDLELKYVVQIRKEMLEKLPILEKTGVPLIYIPLFFLLLFLLSKIFAKLSDIKFKRKMR
jgi:hypothetical protein